MLYNPWDEEERELPLRNDNLGLVAHRMDYLVQGDRDIDQASETSVDVDLVSHIEHDVLGIELHAVEHASCIVKNKSKYELTF